MVGESWDEFRMLLLEKGRNTDALQALEAHCGSQSERTTLVEVAFEKYDTISNPAHMGFKKTYGCAELVQAIAVETRRMGYGNPLGASRHCESLQQYFA